MENNYQKYQIFTVIILVLEIDIFALLNTNVPYDGFSCLDYRSDNYY